MASSRAGIVDTGRLTSARRAGDGWLVVYGGRRDAARAAAASAQRSRRREADAEPDARVVRPRRPTSPPGGRRTGGPSRRAPGAGRAWRWSRRRPRRGRARRRRRGRSRTDSSIRPSPCRKALRDELGDHEVRDLSCSSASAEPCAVTMSLAMPAEPALRGSSRVVVPVTGPPLKTSDASIRRMPPIARAFAPRRMCSRCARPSRSRAARRTRRPSSSSSSSTTAIVARGEGAPVDYWGETPEGIVAALEADGGRRCSATTCSPARRSWRGSRAWDGPQGAKMALDGVAARLARQARRPADLAAARHRPRDAADLVHDRDRHGRGDRGPDPPRDRLRGAQDQGRRPGRRRAAARGAGARPSARLRIDGNEGWDLDDRPRR